MNINRTLTKLKLDAKKAAPGMMLVAGIGLGVAAIVEFCRKSREALPVIDDYKETMAELTESHDTVVAFAEKEGKQDIIKNENATYRKDVVTETLKTGVELAKIYAVPIALYATSVALHVKSHHIMKERNVALVAAYAGVGNELRRAYSRIEERYGTDVLDEIKHGVTRTEVEERRIDENTGEEVVEKKSVAVLNTDANDPNAHSQYAKFFDEASPAWRNDPEYNLTYLLEVEADCNRLLKADGVLFLNTVYDKLGIPRTRAGQLVGWKYYRNPEDNHAGDNCVRLGIHDIQSPEARDFVNGYNPTIIIDPNVDGEIIDTLPW